MRAPGRGRDGGKGGLGHGVGTGPVWFKPHGRAELTVAIVIDVFSTLEDKGETVGTGLFGIVVCHKKKNPARTGSEPSEMAAKDADRYGGRAGLVSYMTLVSKSDTGIKSTIIFKRWNRADSNRRPYCV